MKKNLVSLLILKLSSEELVDLILTIQNKNFRSANWKKYIHAFEIKKNPNVLSEKTNFTNDCLNLILMFVQKCKLNML